MTLESQLRAGALAGIFAGTAWIVGWTLDVGRDSALGAGLAMAGYVLALFAFTALHAFQARAGGALGVLGYACIVVACALFAVFPFVDLVRASGVVPEADSTRVEGLWPTRGVGVVAGLGFLIGFPAFGLASVRARRLARGPGIVLALAALAPLMHAWLGVTKVLPRLGGVALIGYGASLWLRVGSAPRNEGT